MNKLALFLVLCDRMGDPCGRDRKPLGQARGLSDGFEIRVKNGDSRQVLAVAETFNNPLQFFERPALQLRLDVSGKAFSQHFRPALQFSS
jgi:hypothetical protein